ncbi:PfkB family carbohydrate kinase [Streptomyces sp. NPDC002838]|uniref:PfkB family carbohydrate kinase n=1 Tax=Streptomyces sp. NPDC002838 TaxID=3154436 RepID=UPI003321B2C2
MPSSSPEARWWTSPRPHGRWCRGLRPRPGGSCLNVAAGLGRLRVPTALLARISDDHFGDLLRAHLAASGTRLTQALPASDPTTLAAVHLREDGSAAYSFQADGTADRGLRPEHLAALPDGGALPAGTALHLGSLGLLLEPLASTLDGLIRRERAGGWCPSIRTCGRAW